MLAILRFGPPDVGRPSTFLWTWVFADNYGCCALVSTPCCGDAGEVLRGVRQKADRAGGRWWPVSPSVGDTFVGGSLTLR